MKLNEASVMVVDDETALRDIFAKWLRQSGCQKVLTANNGLEAMEAIAKTQVDVLITDVRMPVMDGVELVRKLTEMNRRLPCIIFVSGFGDVDLREMYDLGVEAFLTKPFRIEDLSTSLENALADRRALWTSSMETPPRQSLRIEIGSLDAVAGDSAEPCFRLGRGGFSARSAEAIGLGKVAFDCSFSNRHPPLKGEGYVRWRSRTDHTLGIEFAFLDAPGREWILDAIEREKPLSFIPAL
jgi:CheY-like chemotaxis protein